MSLNVLCRFTPEAATFSKRPSAAASIRQLYCWPLMQSRQTLVCHDSPATRSTTRSVETDTRMVMRATKSLSWGQERIHFMALRFCCALNSAHADDADDTAAAAAALFAAIAGSTITIACEFEACPFLDGSCPVGRQIPRSKIRSICQSRVHRTPLQPHEACTWQQRMNTQQHFVFGSIVISSVCIRLVCFDRRPSSQTRSLETRWKYVHFLVWACIWEAGARRSLLTDCHTHIDSQKSQSNKTYSENKKKRKSTELLH